LGVEAVVVGVDAVVVGGVEVVVDPRLCGGKPPPSACRVDCDRGDLPVFGVRAGGRTPLMRALLGVERTVRFKFH
jgi:hypothetical protein